jgi:hypothetical protein
MGLSLLASIFDFTAMDTKFITQIKCIKHNISIELVSEPLTRVTDNLKDTAEWCRVTSMIHETGGNMTCEE